MLLIVLFLLIMPIGFCNTFLLCQVEGTEILPSEKVRSFKESVSVYISENEINKYMEITGSNDTNTMFIISSRKRHPYIKNTEDLSENNQWYVINSGASGKFEIENTLIINRMTGLIHVQKRFGPKSTYFSGPCTKSSEKKF